METQKGILEYGELIPGFTLRKKTYELFGDIVNQYEICKNNLPIFEYSKKPISFQKFSETSTCVAGWTYLASEANKKFTFIPRIGAELYDSILKSGWSVEKINEEKRYNELDQSIYLFNLAGLLIEKSE